MRRVIIALAKAAPVAMMLALPAQADNNHPAKDVEPKHKDEWQQDYHNLI